MDLEGLTDERLLELAAPPHAGMAFGQFYERHERLVVAFHMRRAKNPEVAADLTSETFAQALASRSRFETRGDGSAAAWLYGIARFKWLEHSRRTSTEHRLHARLASWSLPEFDETQREAITDAALDTEVLKALESLPRLQREAVRAYVFDDKNYQEIAERLGSQPATIRKRVSRGLATLRGTLEKA